MNRLAENSPTSTKVGGLEIRYTCDSRSMMRMTSAELRGMFVLESLFRPSELNLVYTDVDRAVVGGAMPTNAALRLEGGKEFASATFCERREVGIVNIGSAGSIEVDGTRYEMSRLDCLYVGRGAESISLTSADAADPAAFYILSYPAHRSLPVAHAKQDAIKPLHLGAPETANERYLYKYIHPDGIESCQLALGVTQIATGSVWNTMPPHTHERRTEIYFYFDVPDDHAVLHLMGTPEETRHVMIQDRQAVVSPSWSIHSGVGTSNYSFIWGMGGENQAFDDMDHLAIGDLH